MTAITIDITSSTHVPFTLWTAGVGAHYDNTPTFRDRSVKVDQWDVSFDHTNADIVRCLVLGSTKIVDIDLSDPNVSTDVVDAVTLSNGTVVYVWNGNASYRTYDQAAGDLVVGAVLTEVLRNGSGTDTYRFAPAPGPLSFPEAVPFTLWAFRAPAATNDVPTSENFATRIDQWVLNTRFMVCTGADIVHVTVKPRAAYPAPFTLWVASQHFASQH